MIKLIILGIAIIASFVCLAGLFYIDLRNRQELTKKLEEYTANNKHLQDLLDQYKEVK